MELLPNNYVLGSARIHYLGISKDGGSPLLSDLLKSQGGFYKHLQLLQKFLDVDIVAQCHLFNFISFNPVPLARDVTRVAPTEARRFAVCKMIDGLSPMIIS